ncbi:SpoIIE family protein phosphatase [Lysinibacillus piscis]|uniref:Stage II sporulation protein E n=1 Tax=Lysinibacillus piscis TaxID=2518931 RepID=A0ABQ5NQW2_9BACI|nr:SpoIIE family protein phosphatase [Lysinibacillus sp. KH24]GLC90409.1 stage II sporulation protein E [Lysinibacillus sp. KH24]
MASVEWYDTVNMDEQKWEIKKRKWMIGALFFVAAFFLAQSVVFEAAVPFAVPFWAVVHAKHKKYAAFVLYGGLIGCFFLGLGQVVILLLQILAYECLTRWRYLSIPQSVAVPIAVLLVQLLWQSVTYQGFPPLLVQFYVGCEVALALIMTLFMQLLFANAYEWFTSHWTYEKLGAGLVVFAAMLTGMQAVVIGYFSLPIFLLQLFICFGAIVGSVPLATVIGAVLGTLIGIAKLSFTGMLSVATLTGLCAGIGARGGRVGIAISSVLPSVFFLFYDATLPLDSVYFMSIAMGSIVFLAIPSKYSNKVRDKLFPQREEVLLARQSWLTDHITNRLEHFQHFVQFMKELVFDRFMMAPVAATKDVSPMTTCVGCFRYERCWGAKNNSMDKHVTDWFHMKSIGKESAIHHVEEQIRYKCVKAAKMFEELEAERYRERINGQYFHGKKMIALQLRDMSHHLNQLIAEMKEETVTFVSIEKDIMQQLEAANIECFQLDVLSNQPGTRKIVCALTPARADWERDTAVAERMILPILYDIFSEPFEIDKVVTCDVPFHHIQVSFRSAISFEVEYDIYSMSKHETLYSGDSHELFQLHPGLFAVLLSDGMGQSKEAQQESRKLIHLMRECLKYNMNPETAMHTLHYVMSLQQRNDMYATLDFALIDLQHGDLWSWKAGGMSTYIVRGQEILKVESNAAPVGFLSISTVEAEKRKLKAGDVILMHSDGLFSNVDDWDEQEDMFLTYAQQVIGTNKPIQEKLTLMMQAFQSHYSIEDDCTVLMLEVTHVVPTWAVFKPTS